MKTFIELNFDPLGDNFEVRVNGEREGHIKLGASALEELFALPFWEALEIELEVSGLAPVDFNDE